MNNQYDFTKINFSVTGGIKTKNGGWDCYLWNVTIINNNQFFNTQYFCGLGHVIKSKFPRHPDTPKAPSIKDVMYSLLLDMTAIDESFFYWCDEYGYERDSIKALNIYNQCCETGEKLKKLFSNDELNQMREALQDY